MLFNILSAYGSMNKDCHGQAPKFHFLVKFSVTLNTRPRTGCVLDDTFPRRTCTYCKDKHSEMRWSEEKV